MEKFDISNPFSELIQAILDTPQAVDLGKLQTYYRRLGAVIDAVKKAKEGIESAQASPHLPEIRISSAGDDPLLSEYRGPNRTIQASSAFLTPVNELYWKPYGILFRLLQAGFKIQGIKVTEENIGFSTHLVFSFANPWFDPSTAPQKRPKKPL